LQSDRGQESDQGRLKGEKLPAVARNIDQKIPSSVTAAAASTEAVRSLAHDLRSPLSSLLSCLNLVLSGEAGDLTPDQRRFLGMARRNIGRMDRMVQDMLDASRLTGGSFPNRRQEVDLGPILKETARLHKVTAARRNLEIDDSGLPESFSARVDPDLVVRMLDNVLGNAVKYTEPAGGLVHVWLEPGVEYPRSLMGRLARHCGIPLANFNLVVQDNGPGLSPAVQRRIFEPFNRGRAILGTQAAGTGLGLSITRRLAESLGGQVRLISLQGRGTTVWLKLPRDPASEHFQSTVSQLAEALAQGSQNGVKPLVGVLDLRRGAGGTSSTRLNLEGYFDREPSDFATAWEPVPGLWMTAVLDPVNWSRRWTLFAARTGGGLEATRWEYLAGEAGEDLTVTGSAGVQHETMVNPAPDGPIKW
jgi:signal transduction histidine kinase